MKVISKNNHEITNLNDKGSKLEITDKVKWTKWKPNSEYTKRIELYNSDISVKRITYKLPKSNVFTFLCPKETSLFPGCRTHFVVTFKSQFYNEYHDILEISTQNEHHVVKLEALILPSVLTFPKQINIPPCLIGCVTTVTLHAEFFGKDPLFFTWEIPEPFSIFPQSGVTRENMEFRISFISNDLKFYRGTAYCFFGKDLTSSESVQLNGQSQIPQMCLKNGINSQLVDFGNVAIGKSKTEEIEVKNISKISDTFSVKHKSHILNNFRISEETGEINSNEIKKFSITFSPLLRNQDYSDRFVISCKDSNQQFNINCQGFCYGSSVSLSSSRIDFGSVKAESSLEKHVKLTNKSDIDTKFHFKESEDYHVFSLNPSSGVVKGNGFARIKVIFNPHENNYYYKTLKCLLKGQDSLSLTLLGTGIDEDSKKEAFYEPRNESEIISFNNEIMTMHDEPVTPVEISSKEIDFGFSNKQVSRDITVLNNSQKRVMFSWINSSNTFEIQPENATIYPLKRHSFQIYFNPSFTGKLYNHVFEAFLKLSDIQTDDKQERKPTWCSHYSLGVRGHTFPFKSETFIPKYYISPKSLNITKETTCDVVSIRNDAPTPLNYSMSFTDGSNFLLDCYTGHILPNETGLVNVYYNPRGWGIHKDDIICVFNYNEQEKDIVEITGLNEKPDIVLNTSTIVFPPTFRMGINSKTLEIQNVTSSTLKFVIDYDNFENSKFKFSPSTGFILPHQTIPLESYFIPQIPGSSKIEKYIKFYCISKDKTVIPNSKYVKKIHLMGEGCDSKLTSNRDLYQLPAVSMNETTTCDILLENNGDCEFGFELMLKKLKDDVDYFVNLSFYDNFITPKSSQILKIKFAAKTFGRYKFELYYKFKNPYGLAQDDQLYFLCNFVSSVSYPLMQVSNIRGLSLLPNVTKKSLWMIFSIHDFNEQLRISPEETEYKPTILHKSSCFPTVEFNDFSRIVFDILGNTINGDPSVVQLEIHNPGVLDCQWSFYFPRDLKIEPELWADTYNFTEEELKLINDVDNGLLTITPKSGILMPNECKTITFNFNHVSLGFHKIPLMLKIDKGRELFIDLFGTTFPAEHVALPCIPKVFQFVPIPIGSIDSTVQLMEILNGGSHSCYYQVNNEIVKELENYFDYQVFKCLNPEGDIPPFSSCMLKWVFSPLEARKYTTNISICINDSSDYVTRLIGVGYDERVMNNTVAISCENGDFGIPDLFPLNSKNQDICLSPEHIRVGIVPVNSVVRRLVFLENNSDTNKIMFLWNFDQNVIKITPSEGKLKPKGKLVFMVEIKSRNIAILNEINLNLNITDRIEYLKYCKELKKYEMNVRRNQEEFIIQDESVIGRNVSIGVHENERIDKNFMIKSKMKLKEKPIHFNLEKPSPPHVRKINVRLTNRTMGIIEYERRFPHKINSWLYFNSVLDVKKRDIEWTTSAKDTILPILSAVIRCIMSENNFFQLISDIQNEPVTTFQQLTLEENSSDEHKNVKKLYSNNGLVLMLEKVMNNVVEDIIREAKNGDFSITKAPFKIRRY